VVLLRFSTRPPAGFQQLFHKSCTAQARPLSGLTGLRAGIAEAVKQARHDGVDWVFIDTARTIIGERCRRRPCGYGGDRAVPAWSFRPRSRQRERRLRPRRQRSPRTTAWRRLQIFGLGRPDHGPFFGCARHEGAKEYDPASAATADIARL
jgi:hypothetical protein